MTPWEDGARDLSHLLTPGIGAPADHRRPARGRSGAFVASPPLIRRPGAARADVPPSPAAPTAVVLIEDDAGDALLVQELLGDADEAFETTWVTSLAEAHAQLAGRSPCVLLDLGLPDADGIGALREVLRVAPASPVVVLTGFDDKARGVEAVAAGAQDYLVKGAVDGQLLARSLRYAMERKRADESARRLHEVEVRRSEARRLERGLLPRPLVRDEGIRWVSRYRPGGGETLLGGDFFDAIEAPDGTLRVIIGDVCGHGPDEAALGVSLRIAWRTLVLTGYPAQDALPALDEVLRHERFDDTLFATAVDVEIHPDRRSATMRLAGHPPPLVLEPEVAILGVDRPGPPLGVLDNFRWVGERVELAPTWSLLLYTDGLIEGRADHESGRLGEGGLVDLLRESLPAEDPAELVDHLIATAERHHRGPLPDDVALVLLSYRQGRDGR